MDDKLQLLLNQIKIDENEKSDFESGKLNKIVCNKAKDKYVFCLSLKNPLPLQTYLDFSQKLKTRFFNVKSIKSQITTNSFDLETLTDYYRHFLENYSKEAPLLKMFVGIPLKIDDDNLLIDLTNKAEEMKFNSIKNPLEKDLQNTGFNIKVITRIDETKAQELREEIEKEKTKVIPKVTEKKESPFIMGREITDEATPINLVTFEMDNVTVDAKIFGIDIFESSKSNFKIITLKITDGTDSMYCKIFCREDDEFNKYKKSLKEGKYYIIRGYTKNEK